MFRKMRRKARQMPQERCVEILENAASGVLALAGDGGYPYAVPLSFVYDEGRIYFHGAKEGHKIDAVRREPKASFCVVARDDVVREKYTTRYASVIVFGRMRILEDDGEKRRAVEALAKKYHPRDSQEHRDKYIDAEFGGLCMMELEILHMTGKENG